MREYITVIRPIAEGITFLEGDKQPFGSYLPALFGIQSKLEYLANKVILSYCEPLLGAVYEGFQKRFAEVMEVSDPKSVPLYLAMMSNPAYKISFLPPAMLR